MKRQLAVFILFLLGSGVTAQEENTLWVLDNSNAIDFSSGIATALSTPDPPAFNTNTVSPTATVCDTNANLLFFTDGKQIWDKNYDIMPNGSLASPILGLVPSNGTVIVPVPHKPDLYYVFSLLMQTNGRLYYTLVDMRRNGGLGDVVPGVKWVELDDYLSKKMVAIKGDACNTWLLVRAEKTNDYKAYEITRGGINPEPVLSDCGTFPLEQYRWGPIDVSPNRRKLAASLYANSFNHGKDFGIELYDFDPLTGKLSNPVVVDTGFDYPGIVAWSGIDYSDVCFSPDNSKLYASCNSAGRPFTPKFIFQFDLSIPTSQAIMASKSTIAFSQASISNNFLSHAFLSLALGNDGKIYGTVASNQVAGLSPLVVIHNPNLAGMASTPVVNGLTLLNSTNPNSRARNPASLPMRVPERPIFTPDTLYRRIDTAFCASAVIDSAVLRAGDTSGMNYVWDNGDTTARRVIHKPGTYYVHYQRDACTDQVDTFQVQFHRYPAFTYDSIACYGMAGANLSPQDSSRFTYVWKNENGTVIDSTQSPTGSGLQGLNPGNYTIQITTPSGCDTLILFTTSAWPQEPLQTQPEKASILYGDSIQLHAFNYQLYTWWPSGSLDSATRPDPVARPFEPTTYTVIGLDENGCRDTGYVQIHIDYHLPTMVPNAFSPNGDGLNEVFKVEGSTHQRLLEFQIFNRWGQEVFFTYQPEDGWDGTFKGKACETDTYFYLIRLAQPPHQTKTLKGEVHLIR